MKNNFKRILSIFLVAVMCLSIFPTSIFADEVMPACPECETNGNVKPTGKVNDTPTCTEAAGVWYVCENDHGDAKLDQEFLVPYEDSKAYHSDESVFVYTAKKDSTCVKAGVEENWYCPHCNTYYKSAAMTPDNAFADADATVIPVKDFDVEASHVLSKDFTWKNGVAPVCGVNGGTKVWVCTVDGCDYTKEEVVEMKEHVWAYDSYEGVLDCTTEVVVTVKCECGATETRVGLGWSHEYVMTTYKAKTCTADGNETYYTCKHCGKFFMYENEEMKEVEEGAWVIPASHESGTLIAAVSVTCTTDGRKAYYDCSACDKYFDADKNEVAKDWWVIEATGHNVTYYVAIAPNCAEDGRTAYYDCKNCDLYFAAVAEGDTAYADAKVYYNGAEVAVKAVAKDSWLTGEEKLGHDFEDKDAVVGNCTTVPTIAHKYCAVCEKNYAVDAGEYESFSKALKSVLATVYVPNVNYNPYKDGADKQLVAVGSEGATITETTQHNWVLTIEKDSTCDQMGVITWHCANCDKYTGTPKADQGIVGLIVYDLVVLNHLAIVDENATIVPAVPGTCVANGKSAYVQCPACAMYLVVGEDGTVDYSRCYANTDGAAFMTAKDADNHVSNMIHLAGYEATCTKNGLVDSYWCLGGCGHVYTYIDGEVYTAEGVYTSLGNGNFPEEFIIPKHFIVHFVEERIAINCGDKYNPAYCYCSCGAIYGVKTVDGELVADYDVTYTAPVAIRQHEYIFVAATYDCGNDGIAAHYECKNGNCDKVFFKFTMGGVDKYIETTMDALKVTATGKHTFAVVKPVVNCTNNGAKGIAGVEKCTVCGYEQIIDPHTYIDIAYDFAGYKLPTCASEGVHAMKCDYCGEFEMEKNAEGKFVIKTYVAEKLPHTHYGQPTWVKRVEATCTVDGNVEYYVCNKCGGKFTSAEMTEQIPEGEEIIPATHKTLTGVIDYAPVLVCGTVYAEQKYCTICDSYSIDNFATFQAEPYTTADATYHVGNVMLLIPEIAPTCVSSGSKAIYTCDKCGKFLVEIDGKYYEVGNGNDYIAPLVHEGEFVAYKAPTCDATGNYAYYVCKNGCGKLYGANEDGTINTEVVYADGAHIIAANGHTQTEANTVAAVPSVCDGVYSVTYGNIKYYVCDDCGKMFADGETAADAVALDQFSMRATPHEQIDHIVDGSIVLAKCTEVGYYAMQCECGYTYYKFIAPLQHKITDKNEEKIDSDCQATGLEVYYYCANCKTYYKDAACTEAWGTSIDDVTIDKKAHTNRDGVVIEATCDNGEFVWDAEAKKWVEIIPDRECQWCDYDGTLAHTWVSGHSEQTCITPESDYKVCKICENIDENTREVYGEKDPTKHGTLVEKITDGTKLCTDSNRYHKVCKLCGETVGNAYAGKHDTTTTTVAATCTATGTKTTACKNCEYKNVETLPVANHKAGSWVTNKNYSDGKTNLYTVADAQAKYCVNKNCSEPNKALDTRAMPDVNFAVSLDNGVVAGATLVNSGKLAVTIKLSAYNKNVNALRFSFEYSENLTFSHVVYGDVANKFDIANGFENNSFSYDDGEHVFTVSSINANDIYQMNDVNINGADLVYAVVYFDIAPEMKAGSVAISNLAVTALNNAEGDAVAHSVGAKATAKYEVLGDLDADGDVKDELQAVMKALASTEYNVKADFDKDGENTILDFKMYQAFYVSNSSDAYMNLVSSKS